jgi:hypothetical protein
MIFLIIFLVIGLISFILLVLLLLFFGRLIGNQIKLWSLAKKGYHFVEHVGEDRVKRTFILKPKETKFDLDGGIYFYQKDAVLKGEKELFKKVDNGLLSKKEVDVEGAEAKEQFKALNKLAQLNYKTDSVILSWGMPTLVYYGNDPNPVNFTDRKKVYDSKVISSYIKRLLLDKEWAFVRMVLLLTIIGFFLCIVLGFIYWKSISTSSDNLQFCMNVLNVTQIKYNELLNTSIRIAVQNSTMIIQ